MSMTSRMQQLALFNLGLALFAVTTVASAAELRVLPSGGVETSGQIFTAAVLAVPGEDAPTAAQVTLTFDPTQLEVLSVSTSGSPFAYQSAGPFFSNTVGLVTFASSGDVPLTATSTLATITVRAQSTGEAFLHVATTSSLTTAMGDDVLKKTNDAKYVVLDHRVVIGGGDVSTDTTKAAEVTLFTLYCLLGVLALLAVVLLAYAWYLKRLMARKEATLRRETAEVRSELKKIFTALHAEVLDQIGTLTKRQRLSAREQETVAALAQALDVSERLLSKELHDVEVALTESPRW